MDADNIFFRCWSGWWLDRSGQRILHKQTTMHGGTAQLEPDNLCATGRIHDEVQGDR